MIWSAQRSGGRPLGRRHDVGGVEARISMAWVPGCRRLMGPKALRPCSHHSFGTGTVPERNRAPVFTPVPLRPVVPERSDHLAMWSQWNGSGTGPVGSVVWTRDWTRSGTVPVARTFVDSQPIIHISKRSSLHGILPQIVWSATSPDTPIDRGTSHDQICEKCPTALTSDDLDTPRAPVQIMLFVAVLFIQRSPRAPQTVFRHHNFGRANHPMVIISYMMSMCIKLK